MASNAVNITNEVVCGDIAGAKDLDFLKTLGITHVVNLGDFPPTFPTEFAYWEPEGERIKDDPAEKDRMAAVLPAIATFIEGAVKSGGKAYVHCGRGVSKASTAVMVYLLQAKVDPSLAAAYTRCKAARPIIRPNDGFMEALGAFEMAVTGASKPSMTAADRP